MKVILSLGYTVEHAGVPFAFRQLATAHSFQLETLLFEPMRERTKAGLPLKLDEMARVYAALVAMSWDTTGPHGALDTPIPAFAEWTPEVLSAYGDAALQELYTGGLLYEDVQALGMAIRPRMLGRPSLGEAADTADFSGAGKGEAPSSPPTSD